MTTHQSSTDNNNYPNDFDRNRSISCDIDDCQSQSKADLMRAWGRSLKMPQVMWLENSYYNEHSTVYKPYYFKKYRIVLAKPCRCW